VATGKGVGGGKSKGGMDWGGSVRPDMVQRPPNPPASESHIPWSLLITLVVLCIVLVIALPVMGVMYMDMNNATTAAIAELERLKEARRRYIKELRGLQDAYENPTRPNDKGQ